MDAPIEGRGVDAFYGRGEGGEVSGQFVGLGYAVAGEGGVGRDSCGGGDGCGVGSGAGVDEPVGAELLVISETEG